MAVWRIPISLFTRVLTQLFSNHQMNVTLAVLCLNSFFMVLKYRAKGSTKKKEVCAYKDQCPVAFLHGTANHCSLLQDILISQCCIGCVLSENNNLNSLESSDIKKDERNWRKY